MLRIGVPCLFASMTKMAESTVAPIKILTAKRSVKPCSRVNTMAEARPATHHGEARKRRASRIGHHCPASVSKNGMNTTPPMSKILEEYLANGFAADGTGPMAQIAKKAHRICPKNMMQAPPRINIHFGAASNWVGVLRCIYRVSRTAIKRL